MRLGKRRWVLVVLVGLLALFLGFDLDRFLSLVAIKSSQADLQAWHAGQPVAAALIFFAGYVAVAALSLPGGGGDDHGSGRPVRPGLGRRPPPDRDQHRRPPCAGHLRWLVLQRALGVALEGPH